MAEKILNVRIALKYDTYANWTTNNPILKAGEVAIATIPTGDNNNVSTSLPAVLMTVGDGTSNYNALPFVSAKAADVHAYAKTPETEFIAWIKQIISTEGAYDAKGSAAQALKDAKAYTDALANGAVKANTDAISAMDTRMGAAAASITTLTGADTVEGSVAKALKDAKAYADGKDAAIAAAKKAGDDAQVDVDALEAKVGTVPGNKTIVEMIADAQSAATYDDTALKGRVSTVEGKVTTLVGSDENKSARAIASEEVAKIVAGADASYDTLKEIADWISNHKTDATAMNSAITALEGIVDGIGGEGEKATVVEYVTDAIAALKIGDYAKAADLTALAGRVTTLEGKAHEHANKALLDTYTQTEADLADAVSKKHEHSNKTVLDGITAEKITAWDKVSEKANDADLATIAKTGNVNDLVQTAGDVLVFDCGSSSVNI